MNQYPENAPKRSRREENFYLSRTVAAKETCDIIKTQIKTRFSFTTSCSAVSLFESKKFEEFEKKFPKILLEDTVNVYSFLEKIRLKTELEIILELKLERYWEVGREGGWLHVLLPHRQYSAG